jgi:hypothetical protein
LGDVCQICRYQTLDWSLDELRHVGRRAGAALDAAPGFISYAVLDLGDDTLASVCIFETHLRDGATGGGERVLQALAGAQPGWPLSSPVAVTTGEVVV